MTHHESYYTVPLALLRSDGGPLQILETALHVGMVNAGLGYRKARGEAVFTTLVEKARAQAARQGISAHPPPGLGLLDATGTLVPEARAQELWTAALAGSCLMVVHGGCPSLFVTDWLQHHRPGEVFFRIKGEWLWQAIRTARHEAGTRAEHEPHPISWREFRLLAAILSAKVNHFFFTFCGWETLQARACGFHSKARFRAGREALPAHCQPLSRQMIRACTDKLEALGFYARCRYSRGKTGGLSAYSFRHPRREDLITAVRNWDTVNKSFKAKTARFRADDLAAFKAPPPKPAPVSRMREL